MLVALSPIDLMKPDEALLDSVAIVAFDPAARSALTPSATVEPVPMKMTESGLAAATFAAMAVKSGVLRSKSS